MTTITKERIEQYAYDDRMCNVNDEIRTMARLLLASMDSAQEPVAYMVGAQLLENMTQAIAYKADTALGIKPLYAAPQPLTDAERAELQESRRILAGLPQMAIDCGWTAAGASAHARCLEDELAAKDAELQQYRKAASETMAWIVHAPGGDQLTTDGDYVANAEGISGIASTPLCAFQQPRTDADREEVVAVMPDFPGRVMTQRECYRAGWDAHHAAALCAGAPVQFGWSKGHFGYHTLFNAISKAAKIQGSALSISVSAFEDAMSAAAPQQEVKGE